MARTFIAVWPPAAVLDAVMALPRPDVAGVRWVSRSALHVTVRFLGDVTPTSVTHRLLTTPLPLARAVVGPVTAVLGAGVVMAPVAGLEELAAAVVAATADLGQPPPQRAFVGHLTLARTRDEGTARRVSGAAIEASFPVDQLAVATSETRPDGARYRTTATVPLG